MKRVKTYTDPLLAELDKSKLDNEGIYCQLADKEIVSLNWFYSNVLGGVKLYVNDEDFQVATELLGTVTEYQATDKSEYTGINKRKIVVWITIISSIAMILASFLLSL